MWAIKVAVALTVCSMCPGGSIASPATSVGISQSGQTEASSQRTFGGEDPHRLLDQIAADLTGHHHASAPALLNADMDLLIGLLEIDSLSVRLPAVGLLRGMGIPTPKASAAVQALVDAMPDPQTVDDAVALSSYCRFIHGEEDAKWRTCSAGRTRSLLSVPPP